MVGGKLKKIIIEDMQKGFTLIELAIVLVVVGLIIVGVVGGRSIIKTAKMNATVSQIQSYKTALNAFKLEFDAIPGDFDEADEYQITTNDAGEYVSCRNRNGNGNGHLEDGSHGELIRYESEIYNFWTHLYGAGLINDISTKFEETDRCRDMFPAYAGTHFPKSKGVGETIAAASEYGDIFLILGGIEAEKLGRGFSNGGNTRRLLEPAEAKRFDQKTDDGKPNRGKVKAFGNYVKESGVGDKTRGKFERDVTLGRSDGIGCGNNFEYNLSKDNTTGCTLSIETDI